MFEFFRPTSAMKMIAAFALLAMFPILSFGRLIQGLSYQELWDQADLVVIAKPRSTQDTAERNILPGLQPDVHVVGVATEFDIALVMKGGKVLKVVLHHYRLASADQILKNGPSLVSFDPAGSDRFILFLKKEADGRYAPVSGQTDPGMFSVLRLTSGTK